MKKPDLSTFHSPFVKNNLEYLKYQVGSDPLPEERDGEIYVLWPNGKITAEKYVSKKETVTVHEYGHQYPVVRNRLYIETYHNAFKIIIPIEQLAVSIKK